MGTPSHGACLLDRSVHSAPHPGEAAAAFREIGGMVRPGTTWTASTVEAAAEKETTYVEA